MRQPDGTASVPETLRAVTTVLLPLVARGTILRRQRVVALGERVDADRRLVDTLAYLRARHGGGPVVLRLGLRRIVLPLSDDHVRHVLDASPDPYATATREKRAALARFEPHGVLISDAADRPERRRWNEAVLDTARPVHRLAAPMAAAAREEARALLARAEGGTVDWPVFTDAWYRLVRRVVLGDAARDDTQLTGLLARLRAQANWAMLAPQRPALTAAFLDRLRAHLDRAEPDSLAAVAATTPPPRVRGADAARRGLLGEDAAARTAAVDQVPQWLFAFDAAGMAAFRALALLATHPREQAAVHGELVAAGAAPARAAAAGSVAAGSVAAASATLRATLLEAVRLWPTTPAILRETTAATELGGVPLPAGTLVLICPAFFHRDRERHAWADDFTTRLWTGEPPRALLVPFSDGPAVCAGRNLVLFLTAQFLAALLDEHAVRVTSRVPIRPGRPLPGTLDPFRLRVALTPRA
jgi:cytochrome P450